MNTINALQYKDLRVLLTNGVQTFGSSNRSFSFYTVQYILKARLPFKNLAVVTSFLTWKACGKDYRC